MIDGVFVEEGHKAIAEVLFEKDFYLVLGTMDNENKWSIEEEPPPFDTNATDIKYPLGYLKQAEKSFVIEDENGEIYARGKRWKRVNYPTRNIYTQFILFIGLIDGAIAYQVGIKLNVKPNKDKVNQIFLKPEDIEDKGRLILGANIRPLFIHPEEERIFHQVITL